MKRTLTRLGIALACSALLAVPAAAQGDAPATDTPQPGQHGGSPDGAGATDQRGSTHADQIAEEDDERAASPREQADETGREPRPVGTAGDAEDTRGAAAADDRTFIIRAAAGSLAEVRFGHLAADKASNEQVKRFAQQMVEDHAKINEDLMTVARELQITEPHELRPEDQRMHERLSKLEGAEFDRAFVAFMLEDHAKDLPLFRQHAKSGQHPRVREFAQSKLPLLEQHHARAKELQQTLGGGRGTTGTTGADSDRPRVYAGDDDQERSDEHVHDDGQGGPEEQPGTSTGTPPQ